MSRNTPKNTPGAGRYRDARGRFLKGCPSPNPEGRPPGPSLRSRILAETRDGEEIVQFFLRMMRGKLKGSTPRDRAYAAAWLAERTWGKPVQPITPEHDGERTCLRVYLPENER